MTDSMKINEAFVKSIINNCTKDEAIRRIAQALTNREAIIRQLRSEK